MGVPALGHRLIGLQGTSGNPKSLKSPTKTPETPKPLEMSSDRRDASGTRCNRAHSAPHLPGSPPVSVGLGI